MQTESVLIIDTDAPDRTYLERQLEADGFAVLAAAETREAFELAETADPDVVLLGTTLSSGSGFELCKQLRTGEEGRRWNRDVPLIMLGENDDAVERVRGLMRGADDFVSRPFAYDELLARMRAVIRRSNSCSPSDRIEVGEIEIVQPSRVVRVKGESVVLAAKEYELLVALAVDPERVFTKEELLRGVWGFRSLGRTRTLDSHASRLRRKLGEHSAVDYVVNVWGVGYRLIQPTL